MGQGSVHTRILVTGASGQLGAYLLRELQETDLDVIAWSGSHSGQIGRIAYGPVDISNSNAVGDAFRAAAPDVVIHAAALSSVVACQHDPLKATCINELGTHYLAKLAEERRSRLIYVSTDLVFDGERTRYLEYYPPNPSSF